MPKRRLVIKEMWNEFSASGDGPQISASKRKEHEELFYAGAVAVFLFMLENPAAAELVDDVMREVKSYCDEMAAKVRAAGYV